MTVKVTGLGPVDELAKALHDVRCMAESCAMSSRRVCVEWSAGRYVREASKVSRILAGTPTPSPVVRDLPDVLLRRVA